jgi:hypothetical protein
LHEGPAHIGRSVASHPLWHKDVGPAVVLVARFRLFPSRLSIVAIMTWSNSFGFLLVGLAMLWLPALAPGLIAAGHFATSTRELWLLFMGTLNTSLGAGVLGWHAMKHAWRVPSWLEQPARQPEPLALPQPTRVGLV